MPRTKRQESTATPLQRLCWSGKFEPRALAKKAGLSQYTVYAAMKGRMTERTRFKIAQVLKLPESEIGEVTIE
ncbi:MAG TPA: hypothetical protein VEJ63_15690 [Planctomycetota bacterium]|nr:hypothetical protein [Planctomycetota bacterium]